MKNITHDKAWKSNPTGKGIMVSEFIHLAYPVIDKYRIKKVLDAACGNGLGVTIPLLRKGIEVECFDHLQSAIDSVKQNAKDEGFKIKAKKANLYKRWPYSDSRFDSTTCRPCIMED